MTRVNPHLHQAQRGIGHKLLAAAALAATFAQLGAMSVQITVLTLALKTMTVALLAVVIAAIALSWQSRRVA